MKTETVARIFEEQARLRPDAQAVVFGERILTYQDLNAYANHLGQALQQHRPHPDMQIALCMERSIEQISAILGILKAGAAYVPLDPKQPAQRLNTILQEGNIAIVVVTSKEAPLFSQFHGQLLIFDIEAIDLVPAKEKPCENVTSQVQGHHLAYVIYTSGTTGTPKGVMIEHQSVMNLAQWFADYSGAYPEQRIDWSSNFIFDMTVSTSIVPLMLGMTIVLCTDEVKKDPNLFLSYLQEAAINIIKITPSYFKELLRVINKGAIPLPSLETVVLGGERLLTADCRAWLRVYPSQCLYNEYGPAEATVAVSQQKITTDTIDTFGTNIPIGLAGEHMPCYVLNEANEQVAPGEAGELHIGGICLARGYVNQAELTREKFVYSPIHPGKDPIKLYKTGDLCRQKPDGAFDYLGRMDQQIKIRGFRIEPGEIEVYLCKHPSIIDAVVLMHDDGLHPARLVAYCILKDPNAQPSYTQIRKYLQRYLPEYMIPNTIVPIQGIPLTGIGKLDHRALPAPPPHGNAHYTAPDNPIEKELTAIWSKELNLPLVGVHDNFFELGGNSLNAARIVTEIKYRLKKSLRVQDFYREETIASLASLLDKSTEMVDPEASSEHASPASPKKIPLSDFQLLLWILKTFEPKARKLNLVLRKRWQGQIDVPALQKAFEAVLLRHSILRFRITKWVPTQSLKNQKGFSIDMHDLKNAAEDGMEDILYGSAKQLINFKGWIKEKNLIKAKLFALPKDAMELQICLPHIISDDVSMDILWNDVTRFYLDCVENNLSAIDPSSRNPAISFDSYVFKEKRMIERHFDNDSLFWENYLENTRLYSFPCEHIVPNMQKRKLPYSTYEKISPLLIHELEHYSAVHKISLNAILCAAVSLTLRNIAKLSQKEHKTPLLINIVKSTRLEESWDDTIGCFLRLDPLKVDLREEDTLLTLAKQIQSSFIRDTAPMHASTILKLASISAQIGKKKWYFLIKLFSALYVKVLRFFNIHCKSLHLLPDLAMFDRKVGHMICVNLRNNFALFPEEQEEGLCLGKTAKNIGLQQTDLENFDNVCDISFFRDDHEKAPYVAISSNLNPEFRRQMASEIIGFLETGV